MPPEQQTQQTVDVQAIAKAAAEEALAPYKDLIEKAKASKTNHLNGPPQDAPATSEAKDLSLDVEKGREMDARFGWRIIDAYYASAAAKGLARPLSADDNRGHEKEWAPSMRKKLKAMHAAAAKGYLSKPVNKAGQNISTFEDGGLWARETVSGEVLAFLREDSIMLSLPGMQRITGYGTKLTMNRQKTAPSAQWLGEGVAPTASKVTWDDVTLGAHKLGGNTTISNDFIRLANGAAASFAGAQLRIVMAELIDLSLISGSGAARPTGVYTSTHADHKVTVNASDNAQNRVTDMSKLMKIVRKAHIPMAKAGVYIMATDDFYVLRDMRTTEGYVFPTLREATPTLNGRPVFETTHFEGLGTSSKNILGYGCPQHLILGESGPMEFEVGESGDDFKNDECSVRGIGYVDFGMLYKKSWAFFNNAQYA